MRETVPNYYHKFHCIADRCKHSCCIGWEIDVDEETMARYRMMDSEMGARIRENIEGDEPHFRLREGDQCPFLNERGLCDIILNCGEDALCDICALHPRFRNFYSSFFETGLGLCCEEAARVVLSQTEPFCIAIPDDVDLLPEEIDFFEMRNAVLSILQNREKSVAERFSELSAAYGFSFDFSIPSLYCAYRELERLDDGWTKVLDSLDGYSFDGGVFRESAWQLPFEQLAVYFVFRHLADALDDGDFGARIRLAMMGCYLIGALLERLRVISSEMGFDEFAELVRMYSSEIEYSTENCGALMALALEK